jgi:predicted kinase
MIDTVADTLARFHRGADSGPEVTANGDPAAVWRVLEDNYANARPFRDVTIAAGDDDAIQGFARTFLARHDAWLRRRQEEHRIRDCHGDLHTEHLCFTGGGLVIFDCIEFNKQFRYCDVASELAFLAMDLDYHERPELAVRLLERYAEVAGDPELPRLAPFYQCYRAYVRGKVDSLKSREPEVGERERQEAEASARRHFLLAYRYTWAYQPGLVVICGLSGTGKSVVAAALARRTGYRIINSDVVRKQLAGLPATARRRGGYEEGLYSPERSAATYHAMIERAAQGLESGRGIILDATFQRRSDRDAARAVAVRAQLPFLLGECRCDEDEVRRRLQQRAQDSETPSDADWNVHVEQRRSFEALGDDESGRVILYTAGTPEQLARKIEVALRPTPAQPPQE